MQGHVRPAKRKDGTIIKGVYDVVYDVGIDPVTGRRKQKWKRIHGWKEAHQYLRERIKEIEQGTYASDDKVTFGEFALRWLEGQADDKRNSTRESYEMIVKQHLIPALGHLRLRAITSVERVLPVQTQGRPPRPQGQAHWESTLADDGQLSPPRAPADLQERVEFPHYLAQPGAGGGAAIEKPESQKEFPHVTGGAALPGRRKSGRLQVLPSLPRRAHHRYARGRAVWVALVGHRPRARERTGDPDAREAGTRTGVRYHQVKCWPSHIAGT